MALVVGLAWSRPALFREANCDFWNLPRMNEEIRKTEEANEEMEVETAIIMERIATKEAVVDALVNEQITLADAVERFHECNAGNEEIFSKVEPGISQGNDDECQFQNILNFAKANYGQRSDYGQIKDRLKCEWEQIQRERHHVH